MNPDTLDHSLWAIGSTRYPRFSIAKSDQDASLAVWFDVLRVADRSTASAVIRRMESIEPSMALLSWITDALITFGGQKPVAVAHRSANARVGASDSEWAECAALWADLTPLARETLVSLSRQLSRPHPE